MQPLSSNNKTSATPKIKIVFFIFNHSVVTSPASSAEPSCVSSFLTGWHFPSMHFGSAKHVQLPDITVKQTSPLHFSAMVFSQVPSKLRFIAMLFPPELQLQQSDWTRTQSSSSSHAYGSSSAGSSGSSGIGGSISPSPRMQASSA